VLKFKNKFGSLRVNHAQPGAELTS
jgi:hypothetical protein